MFTDHMLFSGAAELVGILAMLYSSATGMSIRVKRRNPILLHPTPCSGAPLDTVHVFAVRTRGALSPDNFSSDAHVARKSCDSFPAGRRTSANRKEETSC